ncbi:MAG: double zinc ribbon domain-containing protein [Clostridia bacterium]|nr:double zinc ribbon domain-containing protein [Clostridia bacterium]
MSIENFKKHLIDTLFPKDFTCDICGVETFGSNLCKACAQSVIFNDGLVCPVCGRRTEVEGLCLECKAKPPVFKRAASALLHEKGGAFLVKKFKNGGGYLKEYFADLLMKKLSSFPSFDGIVFVPMTKKAKRKRGYNQSELLAKALSKRTGVPVIYGAVEKVKDTKEQKSLSSNERAENLKSCFKLGNCDLKGKTILLVDDVLTTGTTAETITKLLLKAGAAEVYLITVSSVDYKISTTELASDI